MRTPLVPALLVLCVAVVGCGQGSDAPSSAKASAAASPTPTVEPYEVLIAAADPICQRFQDAEPATDPKTPAELSRLLATESVSLAKARAELARLAYPEDAEGQKVKVILTTGLAKLQTSFDAIRSDLDKAYRRKDSAGYKAAATRLQDLAPPDKDRKLAGYGFKACSEAFSDEPA